MIPEKEGSLEISEIMSRQPVVCEINQSVQEVAKLMKKYTISSVVVLEHKELAGIITVDDIVRKAVATAKDANKTLAKDIMSSNVISIAPNASVREAMELFGEQEIRQVPVMKNNKLVGFLTQKDILRIEPALVDFALDKMKEEEELRQIRIQQFVNKEYLDEDDEETLL